MLSELSTLDLRLVAGKPPLVLAASGSSGVDTVGWVREHRDAVRAVVAAHGSVLVRGLGLREAQQVLTVFGELAGDLMVDRESFASRRAYPGGVYSSSQWPANQPMCMHHELSYAAEFPTLMLFACLRASAEGGATAVADAAKVLAALPTDLAARFERQGWLLTRNYNNEIGASLSEAFGTDDPGAVQAYCDANGIEFEWQPGGGLRTWQRRPAVIAHPVTGQRCWFNQIAFLSEWTLDAEVREFLLEAYGAGGLPFTTAFGDGEPITEDVVTLLNEIYQDHTVAQQWADGDLMLVDNIRCAHSREPYRGPREVLVGMAQPRRIDTDAVGI